MNNKQRINLYMDYDLLAVLDAFAAVTGKTRTAVMHALLRPSMPSLLQLIDSADEIMASSEMEREASLKRLSFIEEKARANVRKAPELIAKATMPNCTCLITATERQERSDCPHHFPATNPWSGTAP